MKQTFIKFAITMSIGTVVLCGCNKQEDANSSIRIENSQESDSEYTLSYVKKGKVSSEVSISCQYSPKEKIVCSFEGESKIIKEIFVEKGDIVTKGQVLAKLDVNSLDELVKEEQHKVEMAQLDLAHAQEMKKIDSDLLEQEYNYIEEEKRDYETYNLNKKKITKEYDNKITDCNDCIMIHQMKEEEYQNEIEEGTLRAPDDGVVTLSRSNLVGMYSKQGEAIVNIIRNDDMTFISEEMDKVQYLKEGKIYQLQVGKGESMQLIDVEPIDMANWTDEMYFEIRVPNLKLETGSKGTMWIKLDEKNNVLYVPNNAIHQSGDKYYVYTVTEEGLRNIQYVTIGITGQENTEIKEGLCEDQSVITD